MLLLVKTSSYRAGAFLHAAELIGLDVAVASERRQVLAAANPAGHLTLNFRNPTEATQRILRFAESYPLDAVVAADDDGAVLAAHAAAALGLPGNPAEAVLKAQNKHLSRLAFKAAGLPSPAFELASIADDPRPLAEKATYPCVLKPLFLSASRGVMRADTPEAFIIAFERLRALLRQPDIVRQGGELAERVLLETYLPGREVALEGLVTEGKLHVLALFDKPDTPTGPFFEETLLVTPSRLPQRVQGEITRTVARSVRALGLRHGPVHAEARVDGDRVWMLEVAPRSIGGLCSRVLRFAPEASLEEVILRHALGQDAGEMAREARAAGVLMLPVPAAGTLTAVTGLPEARMVYGVDDVNITIPLGQKLVPLPEGAAYLGFIFAHADTPEQVERALREAHSHLTFTVAESV